MNPLKKAILNAFATRSYIEKKKSEYITKMYYTIKDYDGSEPSNNLGIIPNMSKDEVIKFIVDDLKYGHSTQRIIDIDYKTLESYIQFRTEEEKLT